MGKTSTKTNKTIYQLTREALNLTREQASELAGIEPSKIERIENEKVTKIDPYDVVAMAEAYNEPKLCNYYCTNECPIGMKYASRVTLETLKEITLEIVASVNSLTKQKERIVEIARDGEVDNEELKDFVFIQLELEKISEAVESLQFWMEKMLITGKIDMEKYKKLIKNS